MKAAFCGPDQTFTNDEIFGDHGNDHENRRTPYRKMRDLFRAEGVEMHTPDIVPIDQADIVLYMDLPFRNLNQVSKQKSFLILNEGPIVFPKNWNSHHHKLFNRVFTWDDRWVKKSDLYLKFLSPQSPLPEVPLPIFHERKFLCAISGAKINLGAGGLYRKRIQLYRDLSRICPGDFDLFGRGWNNPTFMGGKFHGLLNRIPGLSRLIVGDLSKVLRGAPEDKEKCISKYKFAIAFENARYPGYITEKIFDCLYSKTVPLYIGPQNIDEYLPANCYIDCTQFENTAALLNHLKQFQQEDYDRFCKAVDEFLSSKEFEKFTANAFAKTIVDGVLSHL